MGEYIVGALIGILLERTFSVLGNTWTAVRYRDVRASYEVVGPQGPNGRVVISGGYGNQFKTVATQLNGRDWAGSFHFDASRFGVAEGTYRYAHAADGKPDWGYHHLMLMPDGNIAVQWENVSHAQDSKGSVVWVKGTA